jgi:stage II sporulation protein B
MSKAKMTFRFDEPKRRSEPTSLISAEQEENIVVQEETTPANVIPVPAYTTDYGAWESSFDEETDRIEQLIRNSEPVSPPTRKSAIQVIDSVEDIVIDRDAEQHNPFVDMVEESQGPQFTSLPVGGYYRKSRNPSWVKVFASVTGAIVTGAVFGFVVLSLFQGDIQIPGLTSTSLKDDVRTSSTVQSPAADKGTETGPEAKPATAEQAFNAAINSDSKTYYMLQYGVFKDAAGVNAAEQELIAKGMAAFGDTTDQNRVYAGMANAREDALLFAQQLKAQGVELYVRELQIPEVKQLVYGGDAKTMEQFLSQSDKVVQLLLQMSVAQLEKEDSMAFTQAELVAMKDAHRQWTELESKASAGLPEEAKPAWNKMTQTMNTAIISLNEYGKKLSQTHLWGIQSAAMEFVMAEKGLLDSIRAE